MAVNPKSLKNLRPGPAWPQGNQYGSMAAQRRARIQQLSSLTAKEIANLNHKTTWDEMIIRMLKATHPTDHELIMKADAPGLLADKVIDDTVPEMLFRIPPELLAPMFTGVYRDINQRNHTEYIFKGGRGSIKSSFISEVIIELLMGDPQSHVLA